MSGGVPKEVSSAEHTFERFYRHPDGVSNLSEAHRRYELVAKRYVEGDVACHLHMGVRPTNPDGHPHYFCAVFQRLAANDSELAKTVQVVGREFEGLAYILCDSEYGGDDDAMFVRVGEISQEREGVPLGFFTSLVGLYELEPVDVRRLDPARSGPPDVELSTRRIGCRIPRKDRELVLVSWLPFASDYELAEQVVQGSTEVLDSVPEHQPDPQQVTSELGGIAKLSPNDVLGALIFELTPSLISIRLDERSELAFESFEMFVCSVELSVDAF